MRKGSAASFTLRLEARLLIIECAGEWDDPRETALLNRPSIWKQFEERCSKYAGKISGVIFDLTRVSHVGSTATLALLQICKNLKQHAQPETTFTPVFIASGYTRNTLENRLKIQVVCGAVYADSMEQAMQITQMGDNPTGD